MEVNLKKIEPMQIAAISRVDSYSETEKLSRNYRRAKTETIKDCLPPLLGWFYDNPEEFLAHKLRSDVGIPFEGEAKAEGRTKIMKVPAQEVLYTVHKGPYTEVGSAYAALFQYVREKGYMPLGCPIEIYLNDPAKVKESELLTEIQLPIKKK
jgi:effector-binding domain-containing protein